MFKKFGILAALSELLEPHLFGRTGALKFGTIGVHQCGLQRPIFFLKLKAQTLQGSRFSIKLRLKHLNLIQN